jgi:hypothetical protein
VTNLICRYCGRRIVWMEGQGWLHSTAEHHFGEPRTQDCDKRPESDGGPEAGHRLPPDYRDVDAD